VVKGHFVEADPGVGGGGQRCVLFVGRLSPEKGIDTLLRAWGLPGVRIPLKIIGAGPLADDCRSASASNPMVEYLGPMAQAEVYEWMGRALALVLPSNCYEGFALTTIEAFAKGTPVIASGLGAMLEIIEHGRTGLHFEPGDPQALITQVEWMLNHPEKWHEMRVNARAEYESKYSAESNYAQLMEIYQRVIVAKKPLSIALNPITP
jgi:glycosyltransferase involved in cell wall biosynthesis